MTSQIRRTGKPPRPALISLISANILRRAAIVAVILGTTLTLINQFNAIFGEGNLQYLSVAFVYLAPFVVVALSQALGVRRAMMDTAFSKATLARTDNFMTTAVSHGIPARAALVGLIVGVINTAIVVSAALIEHGNLGGVPAAPIAQAFVLPMVFGLVSQAISYRRTIASVGQRIEAVNQVASI